MSIFFGALRDNNFPNHKSSKSKYFLGLYLDSGEMVMEREQCDTTLCNGKIVTVDDDFAIAEPVAIGNGKSLRVGGNAEVPALAGPNIKEIEFLRKTVLPLIDTFIDLVGKNS